MPRTPLRPDQRRRVKELFEAARQLPPGERRASVFAGSDDEGVREEVLALLANHSSSDGFLEVPARALLEPGIALGPYEIRAHLGGGGMGEVYRAHDRRLARDVAVKVLHGRFDDDAVRARFEREARAIAALSHPNVLTIYDVGTQAGSSYLVTELLEGETLHARLRRDLPPIPAAVEWAVEIARGLAAAHGQGILHRDLKPENIFLLRSGGIKLLDFGIARSLSAPTGMVPSSLTMPGQVVGTAGYLAPEQARGQGLTAAADLFALGATLFEMLTGARAFRGDSVVDTLRAILEHEPPPPSSLRAGVPPRLDSIVARCLAKDVSARFQSASDLAFALGTPADAVAAAPSAPRRRLWPLAAAAAAGALLAVGALGAARSVVAPIPEPTRPYPLTFSGRDRAPAVSPDGRFLAVASDRDGRSRIWLQLLEVGRETALTEGPDDAPRFSPDGGQLLFTRAHVGGTSLYRVSLLGGDARKVVDDGSDGDWSPDGRQIVFVRWGRGADPVRPAIVIANVDGSSERELARVDYRRQLRPRWSPDGRWIAVTGLVQQPGAPQTIALVPVDGSPIRRLATPNRIGLVSAVAWQGATTLLYSQATSVSGNNAGGAARVVRQPIAGGAATTLLWSAESSLVLDRWPGRGVVFDVRSSRQNLREVRLDGGGARFLSRGTSSDRQPAFSPDGKQIIFSSNRGTNLDIWMMTRGTGETRRLTDHLADDWDPAFTPDGKHLLWSSNRSGNFEIWIADSDGSNPRQVTHDGVDAENPTATRDGRWIVYSSGAAGSAGVWRIRPDGTDAKLLVPEAILPEVSPDGNYVLFQTNRNPRVAVVGVASLPDGAVLDFEISIDVNRRTPAVLGRARWMPDTRAIAFLGQDPAGATGVYSQRFIVGEDTRATRTPLAGFDPEVITESFAVHPTGDALVLADWEQRSEVMAVRGLGVGK